MAFDICVDFVSEKCYNYKNNLQDYKETYNGRSQRTQKKNEKKISARNA